MRFVSVEEFCGRPELVADGDLVLIRADVPIAMMLRLHDKEVPAELQRLIRRGRAEFALRRSQDRAKLMGLDSLTMEEIDAEIAGGTRRAVFLSERASWNGAHGLPVPVTGIVGDDVVGAGAVSQPRLKILRSPQGVSPLRVPCGGDAQDDIRGGLSAAEVSIHLIRGMG